MIDPRLLRGAFRVGVFVAGLALLVLPFEPRGSPEFVVAVLAAVVGGAFLVGVALLARWGRSSPPYDNRAATRYTTPARRRRP